MRTYTPGRPPRVPSSRGPLLGPEVGTAAVPRIVTLTGASGCGKSTVVDALLGCEVAGFLPEKATKFTTRSARDEDGPDIVCVERIPAECDLGYDHAGVRYGVRSGELVEMLARARSPLVIASDIRLVAELRRRFGSRVLSMFVHREVPSRPALMRLAEERGGEPGEYERRFERAQAVHRTYVENIHLFSHTILNTTSMAATEQQVRTIVEARWHDGRQGLEMTAGSGR